MSIGKITLVLIVVILEIIWVKCLVQEYRYAIKNYEEWKKRDTTKLGFVGIGLAMNLGIIIAIIIIFIIKNW